ERRELSNKQPLSIGRHDRNDVVVDDDDVSIMHCRISWQKRDWEVVAANLDGVEVNGTLVRKAKLAAGDVLRVGPLDIGFVADDGRDEKADSKRAAKPAEHAPLNAGDSVELKPTSEDAIPLAGWSSTSMEKTIAREELTERRHREIEDDRVATLRAAEEFEEAAGGDEIRLKEIFDDDEVEERGDDYETYDDDEPVSLSPADADDDDAGTRAGAAPVLRRRKTAEEAETDAFGEPAGPREPFWKRLKKRVAGEPVRPGEQDILRHPLVLTLGGGGAILLLVSVVIWFMVGRQSVERDYQTAVDLMESRDYPGAIREFTSFIQKYPASEYTEPAIYSRGKARVLEQIGGTSGRWKEGLAALHEFIDENRDRPNFGEHLPDVVDYASRIALGAAKTAMATRDRELLKVIDEARTIVARRSPSDKQPEALLARIGADLEAATLAVEKQEFFDEKLAAIEAALKGGEGQPPQPIAALQIRDQLLDRYPDLVKHDKVVALLKRTLDTEKSLVLDETDVETAAHPVLSTDERAVDAVGQPTSLTLHARVRGGERPDGEAAVALAVAGGCCYGIDAFTGQPLWRRPIGLDSPLFPLRVETDPPGVVLFDAGSKDLALVEERTGKLVWRLELGEDLGGPPLVEKTQCVLPTLGRRLYKIDLGTGRITRQLRFSQPLMAPPVLLSGGKHAVVAGDRALLYVLSMKPLECRNVTYLGHGAGTIDAPLVSMGRLLLVFENDRPDGCRLRILDAGDPEATDPAKVLAPVQANPQRVAGQVRDPAVLRRNQLFVPSTGERITAFVVSDEQGKPPLVRIAGHQLQVPHSGPMHLYAGANGQLWMGTSAVRKFDLEAETLKVDPTQMPRGTSSQPLWMTGQQYVYSGRRSPYSSAVLFTRADRDQLVGEWLVVLGEPLLAWTTAGDSLVTAGESGNVFRVTADALQAGGFVLSEARRLPLHEDLNDPLGARELAGGRLAVYSPAPEPRVWVLNSAGQIERGVPLDDSLEADPVALGEGLALPLPGRLKYVGARLGEAAVADYLMSIGDVERPRWVHLETSADDSVLAVDSRGKLMRIELRMAPKRHLYEVAQLELPAPVDVPFCVYEGKAIVADASPRLHVLDALTLDALGESPLDSPATSALYAVDGRVYVETGGQALHAFALEPELKRLWTLPLVAAAGANGPEPRGLAGAPLATPEGLLVTDKSGVIRLLDAETGEPRRTLRLPLPITHGPRLLGPNFIAATIDGSIYRIDPSQMADAGEQAP
ncbi:MAG: PQQ-binding-like beta-propeller repeat protein, partial [Planctomycetes bacterium]|nr:PQQ-binding-like beta-propeller repeat protein [Planctomycetota bacterium]